MKKLPTFLGALVAVACGEDPYLASIEIMPGDTTIWEDETAALTVGFHDQNGEEMAPTNLTWSVDDPTLATIDAGVVNPLTFGETVVTAEAEGMDGPVRGEATITINMVHRLETTAYITQSNQDPENPIRLLAGRKGLLRIHARYEDEQLDFDPPEALVTLSVGGMSLDTTLSQAHSKILRETDPSDLAYSYNVHIPGDLIQTGLELEVSYDPDNKVREVGGSLSMSPEVIDMHSFKIMLVPVSSRHHPDPSIENWTKERENNNTMGDYVRSVLPIASEEVTSHALYETGLNWLRQPFLAWVDLLRELATVQNSEGLLDHYYYGTLDPPRTLLGGVAASIGCTVSTGLPRNSITAHEIGHCMFLLHTECGGPNLQDPDFPHSDGRIGHWGWDPASNELYDPETYRDMMGNCPRYQWISPYHLNRATQWRLDENLDAARVQEGPVLLLSGLIAEGELSVYPVHAVTGLPELGERGPYRADGFDGGGEVVFSHWFAAPEIPHGEGARMFLLRIPVDGLAVERIVVSGPEGRVEVSEGSMPAEAILKGPEGRVRAIRKDWDGVVPPGWTAEVSTGLPIGGIR